MTDAEEQRPSDLEGPIAVLLEQLFESLGIATNLHNELRGSVSTAVQLVMQTKTLAVAIGPQFDSSEDWQWYWPRWNYLNGEKPIISLVGVLSANGRDRVRVFTRGRVAGDLFFAPGEGHRFAGQLPLIRQPNERLSCQFYRELENGKDISVYREFQDESKLCISEIGSVGIDDAWYYPTLRQAIDAALLWNGVGDPIDGWNRNLKSNRWRKGGDPALERIGEWT